MILTRSLLIYGKQVETFDPYCRRYTRKFDLDLLLVPV